MCRNWSFSSRPIRLESISAIRVVDSCVLALRTRCKAIVACADQTQSAAPALFCRRAGNCYRLRGVTGGPAVCSQRCLLPLRSSMCFSVEPASLSQNAQLKSIQKSFLIWKCDGINTQAVHGDRLKDIGARGRDLDLHFLSENGLLQPELRTLPYHGVIDRQCFKRF